MSKGMNNRLKKFLDFRRWLNKRINSFEKDSNNTFDWNNNVKRSRKSFNNMKLINKNQINHKLKSSSLNKNS